MCVLEKIISQRFMKRDQKSVYIGVICGRKKLIFINVFCIKKSCTFAVRNFSRENSVKTHNKLLIKLNGYIKLQNS